MPKPIQTWTDLRTNEHFFGIIEDMFMLILVVGNLGFLVFDWYFSFEFFREFIQAISNDFFLYYRDVIHPDFLLYDLIFVTIFAGELLTRWLIAIKNNTYSSWWYYPFIHWYDVLGCIPLGTFKWLRLFRIISITIHLDKMGVIHLKSTQIYKQIYKVYQIFIQEAADKALVNLIEAIQRGVKNDGEGNVIAGAIKIHQDELAKVLSTLIHKVIADNYALHREDLKVQIEQMIHEGFENSKEMQKIENIPFIGRITKKLEHSLNDITFQLTDSLSTKLASDEVTKIVENVINSSLDSMLQENKDKSSKPKDEQELNTILIDIIDRSLQTFKEDIENDGKEKKIPAPDNDVF